MPVDMLKNKLKKKYKNIGEILAEGKDQLKEGGSSSATEEAVLLLSYLLKRERSHLFLNRTLAVTPGETQHYYSWIQKRARGVPIQYITGFQNFMGLEFKVSEGVFIPRPETEILVEKIIHLIESNQEQEKIFLLELGVGSGIIPVTICHYFRKRFKDIHFYALDISLKAINLAKENAKKFHCENKITFYQGDLFMPFQDKSHFMIFDGIISNPPYISADEWPELPDEVRLYEPFEALYGGIEGLDFYQKIILQSPEYLKKNGFLALEIGHKQKDAVNRMIARNGYFKKKMTTFLDYYQNDRGIIAFTDI